MLNRDHDSVLYIGHDKDTIEHLNNISICHTYWVKTTGMIDNDLNAIKENFF